MALQYGYFDSEIIGVDEEGMPIFDRGQTSDFLATFISTLHTSFSPSSLMHAHDLLVLEFLIGLLQLDAGSYFLLPDFQNTWLIFHT